MNGQEIIERCRLLAQHTETPRPIARGYLTSPMREVHRLVRGWMEEAGLQTRIDSAGNLRAIYGEGPRVMIGSRLDTLPHAGAYDGVVGVMIAIALVEQRPPCSVEVAALSEGPVAPFIGSRALIGSPVVDEGALTAIRNFGLDPTQISDAALDSEVKSSLEFDIEQGADLHDLGLPLGVVDTVSGESRWDLRFAGDAKHDALFGAAEWIGLVEHVARTTSGLAATVGSAEIYAGAVHVSLDVRHALDEVRQRAVNVLLDGAEHISGDRGLTVEGDPRVDEPATSMHFEWLERAVKSAGYPVHRMTSCGAHSSQILAQKIPASLLFLRSADANDVDAALAVGIEFLRTREKHS